LILIAESPKQVIKLVIHLGNPGLMCLRYGGLLPGNKIVPERIREKRQPYYDALRSADIAYNDIGQYDVSELSIYLKELMEAQLSET